MLKFFKKMERTRNILIVIFALVLVGSLVLLVPTDDTVQENLGRSDEVAARVGSEKITVGEVSNTIDRYRQAQPQFPAPPSLVINQMVQGKVIRLEAERLGLTASDIEVASQIRKAFTPQDGQAFDQARYEQNAIRQAGSVKAFEENIRNQISQQKLFAYVTSGASVSEAEVLKDYQRRNTKFNLTYVPVNTADLTASIKPTDEELSAYFDKNKKSYYVSSPQKKIRYLYLETSKIGEKLTFTDEELKEAFEKLPADKKLAGVNVQEIVLRIDKPENESQVLSKANGVIATLKNGETTVTEEKFSEIAKGQSEKPSTARGGGKVAGLVRENKNNPTDPYQRVLNMKEGEVTEPLKFGSNFYILRRGKSVAKPFEDGKKEIEISRRNSKAYEANAALAGKVAAKLKEVKDVEKVAEEFASAANMNTSEMVRETGYIKPGDEIDKLGISQDFEQGIASLKEANDVGDKIPIPGGFAIPLLVDKKEPRDAEFEEVKDQVIEAVKAKQAREQVEVIAKKIADEAKSASGLSAAAQSSNLKSRTATDFILGSPLGEGPSAATSEALEDAIYALKKGEATKPIKAGDNWLIVGVNSREEANMDNFAKERAQLVKTKLETKRTRLFSDYISSIKQKMETSGKIKVFKEAVAKLDAAARENQRQRPQLPQGIQLPQQPQPPQG